MKYRVHTKNANVAIRGKLSLGEKVNEREVEYLQHNAVPGFFRITYDGKKQLLYEAPCSLSLAKYLKDNKLEAKLFWHIMAQMLDIEILAKGRGLYPAHLLMKPDLVFLEESTLKMYFIYQPVTGGKDVADELFAVIHDIIYQQLKKAGGAGQDFLIDFQNYLQRGDYQLEHVRQYIAQAASGGRMPGAGSAAAAVESSGEEEDLDGYTVMLGSVNADNGAKSKERGIQLTRIRTRERAMLSGDVVQMGRSSQNAYCIVGNASIGRVHAVLEWRGDSCYLKDMGSVNGTSVNGRRLMGHQSCRLQSGDRIQLADEEFLFEIKQ